MLLPFLAGCGGGSVAPDSEEQAYVLRIVQEHGCSIHFDEFQAALNEEGFGPYSSSRGPNGYRREEVEFAAAVLLERGVLRVDRRDSDLVHSRARGC